MLSCQQIVTDACQIAKCIGFTAQGGRSLNIVLERLALLKDFDVYRTTTTINATAGVFAYALPSNYLRARELFYNINGETFYLGQRSLEWFDQQFTGPGLLDYPQNYATDVSSNQLVNPLTLYLYPFPVVSLTLTLRYMPTDADITTPETSSVVPWFPFQDYLIHEVARRLMKFTDDDRADAFLKEGENMLTQYMQMKDDHEQVPYTISLSSENFRNPTNLRPTKQQP